LAKSIQSLWSNDRKQEDKLGAKRDRVDSDVPLTQEEQTTEKLNFKEARLARQQAKKEIA